MNWRVSSTQAGRRLLQFLREECSAAPSVKAIKRAIDGKCCTVNTHIQTFSSHRLHEGDLVSLKEGAFHEKEIPLPTPLYEDEELLIVHKPAGVLSESLPHFPVHRLDKETSGVLILAKTPLMQTQMMTLFKQRQVEKRYLALVDGSPSSNEGVIDNHLGKKGGYEGQTLYGAVSPAQGMRAITQWRCLCRSPSAALLLCSPRTGRTHQLRVHLSEQGHPILGDRQYARHFKTRYHPERNLLHAYQVSFSHPRTHAPLKITAPIPVDFKEALDAVLPDR